MLESIATIPGVNAEILEIIPKNHSKIVKRKLKNVTFPRSAMVGAVLRDDDVFIPSGDTQIRPGDRVVVFSLPRAVEEVEKLFK
jgi:trk system potassium uptake protein TrkA